MKKILSVSILAVLAVAPLSAMADPTAYHAQKSVADASTDSGVAAVSYVKGAYDAAVGVVEMEHTRATGAESGLSNRIGTLIDDGNYIKDSAEKNVSENLGLLDAAVKANADHIGDMGDIADSGAVNGAADLVTAVNNLNTAVGNAGTASTVGSGHHYVGSDHLNNADQQANTADDNTVANNIIALDNQVFANTTDITRLDGGAGVTNSVSNKIKLEAAGADYNATTSGLGVNTIQAAIDAVDANVDILNGAVGTENSVLNKIKLNAKTADFATQNANDATNLTDKTTITTAIDQLDTEIYNLKSGNGSVANQIKTQAQGADFTATQASGLGSSTLQNAVNEVASRKVPVYTTWGANGAASDVAKVALVNP